MFWDVTFIYNAFIRTTDHCKVQTAFASRVVKNYTGSFFTRVPDGYPGTRGSPTLGHLTNFLRIFTNFLISENSLKFAIFFAEVTNSRSMAFIMPECRPVKRSRYLLVRGTLRQSQAPTLTINSVLITSFGR